MDILGPISRPSIVGHKYFLIVVEDYTRYYWIFLMKSKSKTSPLIKAFVKMVQTHFNTTVKTIKSDNEPEFF